MGVIAHTTLQKPVKICLSSHSSHSFSLVLLNFISPLRFMFDYLSRPIRNWHWVHFTRHWLIKQLSPLNYWMTFVNSCSVTALHSGLCWFYFTLRRPTAYLSTFGFHTSWRGLQNETSWLGCSGSHCFRSHNKLSPSWETLYLQCKMGKFFRHTSQGCRAEKCSHWWNRFSK